VGGVGVDGEEYVSFFPTAQKELAGGSEI
jgi:hypothetical protein